MSARHTYTAEEITAFHRALQRACGLPPLTPGYGDQTAWWTFLESVRVFEAETEEGRFTIGDLEQTLAEMNRQNASRDRQYRTTMRPTAILRDPEKLRDLILIARENKRARKRPAKVVQAKQMADFNQAVEVDPAADSEPLSLTALMAEETARLNAQQP